jgi:peroxiredoxin Q/BCP
MTHIGVGDVAPDFSLRSQAGETVSLKAMAGKELVLYFYPKDNTPGCTTEAKAFRDSHEVFTGMGVTVLGVSSDSVDSHKGFAAKCNLPFTLLSDPGGKVRKLYGVQTTLGFLPGRVTFVIDKEGKVRYVFSSQTNPARHVEEAVKVLKSMRESESSRPSDSGAYVH